MKRTDRQRRARRRARKEREKARVVQEAFDRFMDHAVDRLVAVGVEDAMAMETVFTVVQQLGEEKVLPPFPEGDVHYSRMGTWLVAAADFGLADFVVEAVVE